MEKWQENLNYLRSLFLIHTIWFTQYNPLLPNLKTIIRNHLPISYSNQQMLDIFPHNIISVTYKRNNSLREISSPSSFPGATKPNEYSIKVCNKKCDICKNIWAASPDFACFANKQKYKVMGILKCDSKNVIYLISCKCCGKQYVGFVTGFKERFRIHKSDINIGKIRCQGCSSTKIEGRVKVWINVGHHGWPTKNIFGFE